MRGIRGALRALHLAAQVPDALSTLPSKKTSINCTACKTKLTLFNGTMAPSLTEFVICLFLRTLTFLYQKGQHL